MKALIFSENQLLFSQKISKSSISPSRCPQGPFCTLKIAVLIFPEGDDDGDGDGGGGGRILSQGQARYSNAPRDEISRSGNPLTSIKLG